GGLSDAVQLTLPVRELITAEITASAGAVRDSVTEIVRGPGDSGVRAENATLDLWPSLTSTLPQTVKYLQEYPFESAELVASRLITELSLARAQGDTANAA